MSTTRQILIDRINQYLTPPSNSYAYFFGQERTNRRELLAEIENLYLSLPSSDKCTIKEYFSTLIEKSFTLAEMNLIKTLPAYVSKSAAIGTTAGYLVSSRLSNQLTKANVLIKAMEVIGTGMGLVNGPLLALIAHPKINTNLHHKVSRFSRLYRIIDPRSPEMKNSNEDNSAKPKAKL